VARSSDPFPAPRKTEVEQAGTRPRNQDVGNEIPETVGYQAAFLFALNLDHDAPYSQSIYCTDFNL
jgi:hypothetical protein